MNKPELSSFISKRCGLPVEQAAAAVDALIVAVRLTVKKNGNLYICGLGKFTQKRLPARNGFNPRSGQPVRLKAKKFVNFTASAVFNDSLND